jgi:putative lipoprotein
MRRALAALTLLVVSASPSSALAQAAPPPSPEPEDAWFGPDKAIHLSAAFGISVAGYVTGVAAFDERWAGLVLGFGVATALGGIKEGIDAAGAGQPSWKDFFWDVVGASLGVGLSVTFDAALRGPIENGD